MSKLYLVFTIETDDAGDNFTINKLFSDKLEAYRHKFRVEFNENTEYYHNKNKDEWQKFVDKLDKLTLDNLEEYIKEEKDITEKFLMIDKYTMEIPNALTNVKEMTVDSDNDKEMVYSYC